MLTKTFSIFILLIFLIEQGNCGLYCYRCHSNSGGCGEDLKWFHWAKECPEPDDKCVKIIERKEAEVAITRDCLSSFRGIRTDIPADHYEGCRPAAKDMKLAHYVNNSIAEQDVKRDYYDEVNWCICYFDNRCNGASNFILSTALLILTPIFYYFTT
ncbi:uncharacterized protein LOC122508574 [Leptopilina heterotoma]|uniref:uncharacterized protein LOC122508574 n=1 Tax=Leptopilina heterotoma TaxID=63436 RepID=UPI001CA7DB0D|nr:uncharacterized protein LOC122508574 [Leptopilina heterotoma]